VTANQQRIRSTHGNEAPTSPRTRGARQEAIIPTDREIRAIKVEALRQLAADLRRGARWSTGTEHDDVLAGLLERRADRIEAGEVDHTGIDLEELGETVARPQPCRSPKNERRSRE
jgi:hypothetical protein